MTAQSDQVGAGYRCPLCWLGALLMIEAVLALLLGQGVHAALDQRSVIGPLLLWLHKTTFFLAALGGIAGFSGIGRVNTRRAILHTRRSPALLGLHLVAFGVLIAVYLALAAGLQGVVLDALAVGLLLFCGVSGFLLLVPSQAQDRPMRFLVLGGLCLALAGGLFSAAAEGLLQHLQTGIEKLTLQLTLWLLDILKIGPLDVLRDAASKPVLAAHGFAISIAASCAGYEGVGGAVLLILLYAMAERGRLRPARALLLAVLACLTVFVVNALRIALLFALGVQGHAELALNGFHSHFGVLGLLIVVGGTIGLLQLPFFLRRRAPGAHQLGLPISERALRDLVPAVTPLALAIGVSLVTGLFSGSLNWLYPVHILAGAALLWHYRGWLRVRLIPVSAARGPIIGGLVYLIWIVLVPDDAGHSHAMRTALAAEPVEVAAIWLGLRVIGATLIVPLLEESAFRGGIQPALGIAFARLGASRLAPWLATGLAAISFGLLHDQILAGTIAGLGYGLLALGRARLGDAVLAHAITNALLAAHVLSTGQLSYW